MDTSSLSVASVWVINTRDRSRLFLEESFLIICLIKDSSLSRAVETVHNFLLHL